MQAARNTRTATPSNSALSAMVPSRFQERRSLDMADIRDDAGMPSQASTSRARDVPTGDTATTPWKPGYRCPGPRPRALRGE